VKFPGSTHLLIGVIGSHAEAEAVRADIREFFKENLRLELSMEKTLVTHAIDKARFLGYDVTKAKLGNNEFVRRNGARSRRNTGIIKLYVPKEKWVNRLINGGMMIIQKDNNGKEYWNPIARKNFVNRAPMEIVGGFNAEIRGLYNYYALANNVSVLQKYRYIAEYSMYRTFASKYRCSLPKVKERHTHNRVFSISYVTPKGEKKRVEFYHDGFRKKTFANSLNVDVILRPATFYNFRPKELIVRLLKGECEWCGKSCETSQVKQVKKMTELKVDIEWQALMLRRHRKTLALCHACYEKTLGSV